MWVLSAGKLRLLAAVVQLWIIYSYGKEYCRQTWKRAIESWKIDDKLIKAQFISIISINAESLENSCNYTKKVEEESVF